MLHSFHCHYPAPQTPHIPSSQGNIVHKNKIECSRQCRAVELTGRRTAPHCAPSVYTPRRKPASEPSTHRARRARSESRFSKRQTLAVCSCRHAAVLREFQTLGEELVSSDNIIYKMSFVHILIKNILQRFTSKMFFLS